MATKLRLNDSTQNPNAFKVEFVEVDANDNVVRVIQTSYYPTRVAVVKGGTAAPLPPTAETAANNWANTQVDQSEVITVHLATNSQFTVDGRLVLGYTPKGAYNGYPTLLDYVASQFNQ